MKKLIDPDYLNFNRHMDSFCQYFHQAKLNFQYHEKAIAVGSGLGVLRRHCFYFPL